MPVVAVNNISHAFGTDIILEGVSLSIEADDRVGIVGRNGQGKSTLVKVMGGLLKPDSGAIDRARNARIGYLHQDPDLPADETLRGAAEAAFAELHAAHQQLDGVYDAMASADPDELDKLLKKQERLETQIEALGGYAVDHKIDAVLHGLGFVDAQFDIPVSGLSGGQKARLALARLLLEEPDVILLDEPTNHLDIDGRIWLEDFLAEEFRGAVVLISHDRYLLDRVVNRIVEVEQGRLIDYPGNYAKFRELRAERREAMMRAFDNQQTKFKQEEAFIRKYKAGQRAKQAKGRESKLDRQKASSTLERPAELAVFSLDLPKAPRSGEIVAQGRCISKKYPSSDGGEKVLFDDLTVTVQRGERWGIIGPNGAGKTTLVRTLLGEIEPDEGTARLGSNVHVGHFRQTSEGIDPDVPVYRQLQNVILKECPDQPLSEQQARNLAGAFLFSGDEQDREMGVLSGGERARVRLAALLASAKNLIVLDEPTNHLDIPSAERLEDSLALPAEATSHAPARKGGGYDGTMVLISHDRALIDSCCNNLLIFDGEGGVEEFPGNFSAWHEREQARAREREAVVAEQKRREEAEAKRERAAVAAAEAKKKPAKKAPSGGSAGVNGELERMGTTKLEAKIEKIETRIREIDQSLSDPDVWSSPAKCQKLGDERGRLVSELEPLEFEWMRRAEEGA